MASLDDAFITQISNTASARNPNAYLANQKAASRQQQPEWTQQFQNSINNISFEWGQQHNQQNWLQPQQHEWLTPKQPASGNLAYQHHMNHPSLMNHSQLQNDSVSPQQAAAQIAHQHQFQPNELHPVANDHTATHWWFIRPRTATKYCYPKRFNYCADNE